MKRIWMLLVTTMLAVGGFALTAEPASAQTLLPSGFSIWTREYCEDGSFLKMSYLHGPGSTTQGRQYVYRRNGRLCGFTVDHLTGRHWMDIDVRANGAVGVDSGTYDEYAGAIAAPAGRCAEFFSSVQVKHSSSTWVYSTGWNRYC